MRFALLCIVLVLAACAATISPAPVAPRMPAPAVVTDVNYDDALRHYSVLNLDDPLRSALRERLVAYLLERNSTLLSQDNYAAVVEHFASITTLYTPSEIGAGQLPPGLEPLARYLADRGSPKGDEGRVLAALLALRSIRAHDPAPGQLYQRVRAWGYDARSTLNSPLERFEEGLIEVWQEHARLTPTAEVLDTLARLYVERRTALITAFQSSEPRFPLTPTLFDGVQHAGMSVAAVYLRHGDIQAALSHVQSIGPPGGAERRLTELLQLARSDNADGAGALLDLSRAFLEDGRSDVARALCVVGLRQRRQDARFSQCLARVAARDDQFLGAMAWYAEAVRLTPDDRALYDEILEVLSHLMENGQLGNDARQTRAIGQRALEILDERTKRWPGSPPAVRPEDLYQAIAAAEMSAGNAAVAETQLRKSLQLKQTLSGVVQLGLLLERMNRAGEAADVYRHALKLIEGARDDEPQRAEILERLGDVLRMSGKPQEANQMYEEGLTLWKQNLALWEQSVAHRKSPRIGQAYVRRGVLLGRLARRTDARLAFEKAMQLAPDERDTYTSILSYLVVSEPDGPFAHAVFHNAVNQLSLAPEWKVYFSLWLRTIARRGGMTVDSDVGDILDDLSRGDDWSAALAKFASAKLDFQGLMGKASDLGERTVAYFYEGARRLGEGDAPGANEMFQRVLESRLVSFPEYAMAQELLVQQVPPRVAVPVH